MSSRPLRSRPKLRGALLVTLASFAYLVFGLPDGMLGVAWPSMSAEFGVPISSLGILILALTTGYGTATRRKTAGRHAGKPQHTLRHLPYPQRVTTPYRRVRYLRTDCGCLSSRDFRSRCADSAPYGPSNSR